MNFTQEDADRQAAVNASLEVLFSEQPLRFEQLNEHIQLCNRLGLMIEAYRAWRFWCTQSPNDSFAWANACIAAWNARLAGEAIFCASQTLSISPLDPGYEQIALLIMTGASAFSNAFDQSGIVGLNRRYSSVIAFEAGKLGVAPHSDGAKGILTSSTGQLRVGYLWSFFGVGTEFCFPFHHDRNRFHVIAVMPDSRVCAKELIGVDEILAFPLDDIVTANAIIRAAKIDILVVLDGRGGSTAIDILIETRLSPVQTYFGNVFASTFSPAVDALIGDRVLIDELKKGQGNEHLIAVAEAMMFVRNPFFIPQNSTEILPPRPQKYRIGTTGNTLKLSSDFMDLIAKILIRIPDSSFFYGTFYGREDCELARQQLQSRGVSPDQLELYPRSQSDYAAMIKSIDAAIDSIPFNGHLSTYEFLSQGTPVWSLRGPRLTHRYGEMILGAAGLGDYVFDSADALVEALAVRIEVTSEESRRAIKEKLAESQMGDPLRATRLMEAALETTLLSV